MSINEDIDSFIAQLGSFEERERDLAAEYLSDYLEIDSLNTSVIQKIVDALTTTFKLESSQTVLESVLNGLSNCVYNKDIQLPIETIKTRLASLQLTAKEHAIYILENSSQAFRGKD